MTKEQLFIQLVASLSDSTLFHGHAAIDAEDEAMMVLMKVLGESVNEILSSGNEPVDTENITQAENYVKQRLSSIEPMPYILGEVDFCQLNFKCDSRALVPRSPIAELILNGFKPWLDVDKVHNALDLCTGGGCIGISLAKYYPNIQVDISDISNQALALAQENKEELAANVTIIHSDLFENIHKKYDLIVTNPPYVSETEYQELPHEYIAEPKLGLVAQQDGLKIPVEIMLNAEKYLSRSGYLVLEVGYSDELLADCFSQIPFNWVNFSNGGQGVCIFSRKSLLEYQPYFKAFLENTDVI